MEASKKTVKTALIVGLKLLLICAVVAGVVSFVYSVTIDAYQKNLEHEMRLAMSAIYDVDESKVEYVEHKRDGGVLYSVKAYNSLLGYCVKLNGSGFGGDIGLMVGYNGDGSIRGVAVISHSETPGVGEKATKAEHLKQYEGLRGELTISKKGNADVTAISGATISSNAIHEAVNIAEKIRESYLRELFSSTIMPPALSGGEAK